MCGRLCIVDNPDFRELFRSLGIDAFDPPAARYNVAPTQRLDVVRQAGAPLVESMAWGFSLTVRGKAGPVTRPVFNARGDKVWDSPMWRSAIADHRVLVPVSGFYEWQRSGGKPVQAWFIGPAGEAPAQGAMWLAGIARPGDAPQVSIVTTEPNGPMSKLHDRMPVILRSSNEAMAWLQGDDRATLEALMVPADDRALAFTKVSDYVNSARHEGARCVQAVQR